MEILLLLQTISQVFGEIISNSILINTEQFKKNYQNISLVELGPGRGVLARDMLRTFKRLNIRLFNKIKHIYFLENQKLLLKCSIVYTVLLKS